MRIVILNLIVAVSLAFTAFSADAGEYTRLTKKSEFTQAVGGRKVTADWGWIAYGADGNVSGDTSNGAVAGTWKWKGKFYCSNITVGGNQRPRDCFTVHTSGNNIVFIRDQGKGEQLHMVIK